MSGIDHNVLVIGGGQAGLAVAYYLRRTKIKFVVIDAEDRSGGAWLHAWNSLRLFSPVTYSSLAGWPMPPSQTEGHQVGDKMITHLASLTRDYKRDPDVLARLAGRNLRCFYPRPMLLRRKLWRNVTAARAACLGGNGCLNLVRGD